MITISEFKISTDFKTISLIISTDDTSIDTLNMYIGSDYLKPLPINLDSLLSGTASDTLTITLTNLGLDPDTILDGIFTIEAIDSAPDTIVASIANLYYINLCLANMIVANNAVGGWNDINTIYLLLQSIGIFLPAGKIEKALNCYERIVAMMENNPKYLVTTDVTSCAVGSGCWIINGTYVIN